MVIGSLSIDCGGPPRDGDDMGAIAGRRLGLGRDRVGTEPAEGKDMGCGVTGLHRQ